MAKRYLDIVIAKEQLHDGTPVYVANCTALHVTSQGQSIEEAMTNIKEAVGLYLEECPEKLAEAGLETPPTFSFIEVDHAQAPHTLR